MNLNLKLTLYGLTAIAGLIWPFYFIVKFAIQVKEGLILGSPFEIAQSFIDGAWATPTSGFVSADTAVLLVSIFLFYFLEGKRLKMKFWGLYFPLTFLISLAFSFGAFMFMREKRLNSES
tara:strand:+ start:1583 stop:1942 length:360 start_codon:yes stop_codon:yes gene_type:complete